MTISSSEAGSRAGADGSVRPHGVQVEERWREWPCGIDPQPEITVTRWTDPRMQPRWETAVTPDGQFSLGIALTPTRVRLQSGPTMIFDGVMTSGMTYVCHPSQSLLAKFAGPADFLHVYAVLGAEASAGMPGAGSFATILPRDALIDQLARALQTVEEGADERYIETLARAIVLRATQVGQRCARVLPLQKWRLKQVSTYVEAHISEAVSLNDMAAAAGLSRMHFAAQFRLATGCRPHDFVLLQRIETAKRLLLDSSLELVEVALTVGFQAQAHFSTVFKRFVGEPPGRWRRLKRAERSQKREAA